MKVKGIKTALARATKVVEDFNHSRLDSEQLEAELDLPPHCLIQDAVTLWNSTLDLAFRCANSRQPLHLIFMGRMTSTILIILS